MRRSNILTEIQRSYTTVDTEKAARSGMSPFQPQSIVLPARTSFLGRFATSGQSRIERDVTRRFALPLLKLGKVDGAVVGLQILARNGVAAAAVLVGISSL
jgi:hypothetical protein